MNPRRRIARCGITALAMLALAGAGSVPGRAQRQRRIHPVPARRIQQRAQRRRIRPGMMRGPHPHPPGFLERLRDMPPAEQERVLENDARFHRLPGWRQEQIRANLARWNSLPPARKQLIREREAILRRLSPAKRTELRQIFPQYRRLPPRQRLQVNRAFLRLRNLPPRKRGAFLKSNQVRRMNPRQQQVLRRLGRLLSGN